MSCITSYRIHTDEACELNVPTALGADSVQTLLSNV